MSYATAIQKAWDDYARLRPEKAVSVKFLADEYSVDLNEKKIISLSCNVPAKDAAVILILHYLAAKLKGLADFQGEWVNFKELSGVEGYYSAFRERVIEPIIRKYGKKPEAILEVLDRLPSKRVDQADISIVIEAFDGVPVLVNLWRGDEEFRPEANVLFDKSISKIFSTEDVVVLGWFMASSL